MNLTTWNIRGLGSKRKQRNLSNRMKEEKPDMIFKQSPCPVVPDKLVFTKGLTFSLLFSFIYLQYKLSYSAEEIEMNSFK